MTEQTTPEPEEWYGVDVGDGEMEIRSSFRRDARGEGNLVALAWSKHYGEQILADHKAARIAEEALKAAIWAGIYDEDFDRDPKGAVAKWVAFREEWGKTEHFGDCTNTAQACMRCHVELVENAALASLSRATEEK